MSYRGLPCTWKPKCPQKDVKTPSVCVYIFTMVIIFHKPICKQGNTFLSSHTLLPTLSGPSCSWLLFVIECIIFFLWPVLLQRTCLLSFHSCLRSADSDKRKNNMCRRQPVSSQQSTGPRSSPGWLWLSRRSGWEKRRGHKCSPGPPVLELCPMASSSDPPVRCSHVILGALAVLWESNDKYRLSFYSWWNWGL